MKIETKSKWIPLYADIMSLLMVVFLVCSMIFFVASQKLRVAAASVPDLTLRNESLVEEVDDARQQVEESEEVIRSQQDELEEAEATLADVTEQHHKATVNKDKTIAQQQQAIDELTEEAESRQQQADEYRNHADDVIADYERKLTEAEKALMALDNEYRSNNERSNVTAKQQRKEIESLVLQAKEWRKKFERVQAEQSDAEMTIALKDEEIEQLTEEMSRTNTLARRDGAKSSEEISTHLLHIQKLTTELGVLKMEQEKLQSRLRSFAPITVVCVLDVTASMGDSIDSLRSAMTNLFEFMPNTSEDFRIGIVAFRDGVVARLVVTPVKPSYVDDGESQRQVIEFLDSLQAMHGHTDHLPAFREAFSMIKAAHPSTDPNRKERIIFIGDSGPSELDEVAGFSANERTRMKDIQQELKQWASSGNRAVASLYVESSFTEQDVASVESRRWYKALGNVSPNSAFYTDANAVLRAILHASQN